MTRILIMIALSLALPSAAFSAASGTAAAYEVEVVIFETRLPDLEGGEIWTNDTTEPVDSSSAITTGTTPSSSALANAVTALQTDKRYRVLLHKRWTQNADGKETTPTVQLASDNKELDGLLRFYVSRYLHVELNLKFQPPAEAAGGGVYQINEQRRVKSQELNYFDHPKFGALVRITPASG